MLCPCYSTIFEKLAAKAFEALEIRMNFQKIQEVNVKGKEKQNINITISQVQSPYSFSQRKSYVPHANALPKKWFQSRNERSISRIKEFKVNNLTLRRGGTTKGSRKGYYEYQNHPRMNRNMSKTQWREH